MREGIRSDPGLKLFNIGQRSFCFEKSASSEYLVKVLKNKDHVLHSEWSIFSPTTFPPVLGVNTEKGRGDVRGR